MVGQLNPVFLKELLISFLALGNSKGTLKNFRAEFIFGAVFNPFLLHLFSENLYISCYPLFAWCSVEILSTIS